MGVIMRDIPAELRALRLHGMANTWTELQETEGNRGSGMQSVLERLLEAEHTDRAVRSTAHQMAKARFPAHRDLAGFDIEGSRPDQLLIEALATLEFTEAAHNVVFMGGPGTGKTHLGTALSVHGITQKSKRARFISTLDWINALEAEKVQGKAGRLTLLFHLLSKLYEPTRC